MEDKTKSYSISLTESVYNKIKELADIDERSVSATINRILKDYLRTQGAN